MAYRICSISGSGVRVILPATIIKQMLSVSRSLGGKGDITDLCDYVVGTSMGGILGAGLVVPKGNSKEPKFTTEEILNLIQGNASKIFPQNANDIQHIGITLFGSAVSFAIASLIPLWGWLGKTAFTAIGSAVSYMYASSFDGFFTSKYSREGIDELLEESFGDLKLADVIIPFTTVSYSLEQNKPRIWSTFKAVKTINDNWFIKDALGATTATPTFFPHKVTNATGGYEKLYYDIDGSIFAYSPVNLAVAVMLKHAPASVFAKVKKEGISILSMGTGYYKDTKAFAPPKSYQEGKLNYGLVDPLVFNAMDATEKDSITQARNLLHITIRLNPRLDKSLMSLDQSDPNHLQRLSKAGSDFVREHQEIIKEYAECMFFNTDTYCKELVIESTAHYSFEVNQDYKSRIELELEENFNSFKRSLEKDIYETNALDRKLKAEALSIPFPGKEEIDAKLKEYGQDQSPELKQEDIPALSDSLT